MNNTTKKRVIVGMSGGVDSSVTALLLQEQGWQVEGAFMKNWEEDDDSEYCSTAQDLADVQAVCDKLNIPLHQINFSEAYWERVFSHFLDEYAAGRTPNPDILCNKEIKFKAFLNYALEKQADFIATGHYAQIIQTEAGYQLWKGQDSQKDQTYFLYTLTQNQLQHSLFPIGHLNKSQVRKIAFDAGLSNAQKKDSTGICFIGERRFRDFLSNYLPAQPGLIKTPEGKIVGQHQGLMHHTLGQRKGLGIGGLKNEPEKPWYVVKKDLRNNVLVVAQTHDHPALMSQYLSCCQLSWIKEEAPQVRFKACAKIRYQQTEQPCVVSLISEQEAEVQFDQPQRAITPGQSVVFYQGDMCLGGGVITSNQPNN